MSVTFFQLGTFAYTEKKDCKHKERWSIPNTSTAFCLKKSARMKIIHESHSLYDSMESIIFLQPLSLHILFNYDLYLKKNKKNKT